VLGSVDGRGIFQSLARQLNVGVGAAGAT
jgi:hypothetical protein